MLGTCCSHSMRVCSLSLFCADSSMPFVIPGSLIGTGVKVWSFNPPGGMTTKNLSVALRGFVTALVVGKDIISRTGTVTFERLLDQVSALPPVRAAPYRRV